MKLFIATYKQGERQGQFFAEYKTLRIASFLADDADQAMQKAISYFELKAENTAEVSIV